MTPFLFFEYACAVMLGVVVLPLTLLVLVAYGVGRKILSDEKREAERKSVSKIPHPSQLGPDHGDYGGKPKPPPAESFPETSKPYNL